MRQPTRETEESVGAQLLGSGVAIILLITDRTGNVGI
jgi:hypothetical protein